MRRLKRKGKAGTVIPLVVAAILTLGFFIFMQVNETTGYVVVNTLEPGTEITKELLNTGDIVIKQIPKGITTENTIPDFELIEGRYVKNVLTPGHIISAYDIAKTNDLRTNEDLVNMKLEAVSIPVGDNSGIPNATKPGDRVNIYGVYTYEIENMVTNAEGEMETITVSKLPEALKQIFLKNGYKEDSTVLNEEVTVSKLLLQNVPVVATDVDDSGVLKNVIVGLGSKHSELIQITMTTGKVGMALLPFSEGGYIEEETNGVISTLELNISETFKSGEKLE